MVSPIVGQKSLAERCKESIIAGDQESVFKAHAGLSAGDDILLVVATGISEASGVGTATKLNAVVLEDVAINAEGRCRIAASLVAAQAIGSLL